MELQSKESLRTHQTHLFQNNVYITKKRRSNNGGNNISCNGWKREINASFIHGQRQIEEDPRYSRFNILVEVATLFMCKEKEEQKIKEKEENEKKKKLREMGEEGGLTTDVKVAIWRAGGSPKEAMMVIRKELTQSDVSASQSRLLIPILKMKSEFLTNEEEQMLKLHKEGECSMKTIEVCVINPSMEVTILKLRRWEMVKGGGGGGDYYYDDGGMKKKMKKENEKKTTSNYVLNSGWNKIVSNNGLKKGDMVQLWAFRNKCGRLCFVLIKE